MAVVQDRGDGDVDTLWVVDFSSLSALAKSHCISPRWFSARCFGSVIPCVFTAAANARNSACA